MTSLLLLAMLLSGIWNSAARAEEEETRPIAVRIPVEGMINPFLQQFLYRQLDEARSFGANLIILEIDSPGGMVEESFDMANRLLNLNWARTVAYIPKRALSGAAIIALGCDEIVLHPNAYFGDAGPIQLDIKEGLFRHAPEKVLSDFVTQIRALAEATGRSPALAEAMMDRNLEVYEIRNRKTGEIAFHSKQELSTLKDREDWDEEGTKLVFETRKGNFLEVTGRRAAEIGLTEQPVDNFDGLKARYRLDREPRFLKQTWVDSLVYLLNRPFITFLLLVAGAICLYIELHAPGIGVAGVTSGLCFLLFFWSRFLGGTATWLEVLLFMAGIFCLLAELFVIPGFGIAGVTGGILIFASIVLASQTFILPESAADLLIARNSILVLGGAIIFSAMIGFFIAKYLPVIPILGSMMLIPPDSSGVEPSVTTSSSPGSDNQADPTPSRSSLLNQEGVAKTLLRPAGKASIGDQYLDVVAEGSFIPVGSRVRVIDVSGNRIVVREV